MKPTSVFQCSVPIDKEVYDEEMSTGESVQQNLLYFYSLRFGLECMTLFL